MNASGDGMLSSLGKLAAQQEYYATLHKAAMRGGSSNGGSGGGHGTPALSAAARRAEQWRIFELHGLSADEQLEKLAQTERELKEYMEQNAVLESDTRPAGLAVRQSLLHAVQLLVYLLVPDEVCASLARPCAVLHCESDPQMPAPVECCCDDSIMVHTAYSACIFRVPLPDPWPRSVTRLGGCV